MNVLSFLGTSPLLCLSSAPNVNSVNRLGSMDITEKITHRTATTTTTATTTPTEGSTSSASGGASRPLGRVGGMGSGGGSLGSKQTFVFSRCRDNINKLLKSIDETSAVQHVLCVRPHSEQNSRVFNPEYVSR